MYEAFDKQGFMECLPLNKSFDYLVPVGGGRIDDGSVGFGEKVASSVYVEEDENEDVSGGDVSGSDVSLGDVSSGSLTACLYEPKPNLWESDISEYDTTDGLLLLILFFTVINTALNAYRRR